MLSEGFQSIKNYQNRDDLESFSNQQEPFLIFFKPRFEHLQKEILYFVGVPESVLRTELVQA